MSWVAKAGKKKKGEFTPHPKDLPEELLFTAIFEQAIRDACMNIGKEPKFVAPGEPGRLEYKNSMRNYNSSKLIRDQARDWLMGVEPDSCIFAERGSCIAYICKHINIDAKEFQQAIWKSKDWARDNYECPFDLDNEVHFRR